MNKQLASNGHYTHLVGRHSEFRVSLSICKLKFVPIESCNSQVPELVILFILSIAELTVKDRQAVSYKAVNCSGFFRVFALLQAKALNLKSEQKVFIKLWHEMLHALQKKKRKIFLRFFVLFSNISI